MSKIRTFNFPDEIPLALALGYIKNTVPWSEKINTRLDYIEKCLLLKVCPDLKGKRFVEEGHASYLGVPLPSDLENFAEGLQEAVVRCRKLLDKKKNLEARNCLESIDASVAEFTRRADPDRKRGLKSVKYAQQGGKLRKGKFKPETLEILAYVENGHSYGQAALKFGKNYNAIAKLVQRHRKK